MPSLFKDDKVKEFKLALICFSVLILLGFGVLIAAVIFRSEAFNTACQAVQDNNAKLVTYLEESEKRAFKRIKTEESEDKEPVSSKEEIAESLDPLIETLQPIKC